MNCLDAAHAVLKDAGSPLHYEDITRRMIDSGLWPCETNTPERTVNARISEEIQSEGESARFCRVGKGVYAESSEAVRLLVSLLDGNCGMFAKGSFLDGRRFETRRCVEVDTELACVMAGWHLLDDRQRQNVLAVIFAATAKQASRVD